MTPQQLQGLMDRLDAAEARIRELEAAQKTIVRGAPAETVQAPRTAIGAASTPTRETASPEPLAESGAVAETRTDANPEPVDSMTHTMEIPGGPVLPRGGCSRSGRYQRVRHRY